MIKILSTESISDNEEILINCMKCVYSLHQIGKLFFDYEDEIKYISLLQEIKSKNLKEINKDLDEQMTELLNELLNNTKNKAPEKNDLNKKNNKRKKNKNNT